MPFLTQGPTNRKFIGIVAVLAVIVSLAILYCAKMGELPQEVTVDESFQEVTVEDLISFAGLSYGAERVDILFRLEGTVKKEAAFCEYLFVDKTGGICISNEIKNIDSYIDKPVTVKGYYYGYNPAMDPSEFFEIKKIEIIEKEDETAYSSSEDLATDDWSIYRNEDYWFEVKYPLYWFLETSFPGRLAPGQTEFRPGINPQFFHFGTQEFRGEVSLYVASSKTFECPPVVDCDNALCSETIIDGIEAKVRVKEDIKEVYFCKLDNYFRFGVNLKPSQGADIAVEKENIFNQMLSTFRFIKAQKEDPEKIILASEDFDSSKDAIMFYLNQYPDEVDILDKLVVEAEYTEDGEEKIIKWMDRADLDNDGKENLIIGFSDPFMAGGRLMITGFPYFFAIFSEKETGYEKAFMFEGPLSSYYPMHFIRDVNNDNRLEVVVNFMGCGAHTCGRSIAAIQWDGQDWRNLTPHILVGDADFDAIKIEWLDLTGDGMEEVRLYGGTAGSVGAGMQRRRTEIYAYREGQYQLIETKMDPAENIYHLMFDANEALKRNKPDEALVLVKKAFQDPDWGISFYITEEDQARIISYTAIQAMLIYFQQPTPDLDSVESLLEEIKHKYDKSDNPYIKAAQILYNTYIDTEDVIKACKAMEKAVLEAGDDAEFLHWYGYKTEKLDFSNICPLSAEIEIKIYFSNWSRYQKLQEELCPGSYCPGKMYEKYGVSDCDYFFPVIRNIARQKTSLDFIELALKELSKGPNQDEKARGFGEAGPFARMIEGFEVKDGVLILEFNKEEIEKWKIDTLGETYYSLSSCECMQYYGPIMRTLNEIIKIIPGVNKHQYFC